MSTTTQGIDARYYLVGWLKGVTDMYLSDIRAIPDDQWTATHGGCTRAAHEITADAASLLLWCTAAMKGETPGGDDDFMAKLTAKCADKAGAIATLSAASEAFGAALSAASDETLNANVTPPWQMPTPLFTMAHIAVSHIWYHDGQLNYIQSLLGDGKIHWMGD